MVRGAAVLMALAALLRGRVVEPDGTPAVGARVRAVPMFWRSFELLPSTAPLRTDAIPETGIDEPGGAVTDAEGRFELRAPDTYNGEPLIVSASSARHTPTAVGGVRPGAQDVVIRFPVGTVVSGRVVSVTPGALVDLVVELVRLGQAERDLRARGLSADGHWSHGRAVFARARSGPAGRFQLPGVGAGGYDVCVRARDGRVGCVEDVDVGERGAPAPVVISIGKLPLRGRVVERGSGKPLAGVRVQQALGSAVTGRRGVFSFRSGVVGQTVWLGAFPPTPAHVMGDFRVRLSADANGSVGDLELARQP
jgi:hypothetical protein